MAARLFQPRGLSLITAFAALIIAPPVLAATPATPSTPAGATAGAATLPTPPAPLTNVKVPLPRLRPKPAVAVVPAAPASPGAPPIPQGFQVNPKSKFTADEQLALVQITAYFNSFHTMEGKFVQIGPSGEQSQGTFNLMRPGDIRFHYDPPSKLDVISDGRSVAVRDGSTHTQDIYPLSKTPLRYLLADQVNLADENVVDSVRMDPDLVSVLIVEKSALVSGKLNLIFDRKTLTLRQWVVTDAQGLNTSVAIYNITTDKPQDPNQFQISAAF